MSASFRERAFTAAISLIVCAAGLGVAPAQARVTRIVIDHVTSPAFDGASYGNAGQYETIEGRAFGELDPADPRNAIIQDIELAPRNAAGRVEYMATFFLVKPIDMSKSSGLLWQFVPNRGGRITLSAERRADGDIGLSSGWQGDNRGGTAHDNPGRDFVVVPIAKNVDGSAIAGRVMGRIVNAEGTASSPIIVHSNPLPYEPVTLDTGEATLTIIESETIDGITGVTRKVPSANWAWARCNKGTDPIFPGTPDPTEICVRGGFEPNRVYQVVFTAQDPPVLGIGFAAFRDVGSFFKHENADDTGTANPVAQNVNWIVARGSSQSGNMLRQYLHLGFNEDEARRRVHDGSWVWIGGRRVALNFRFAMPDGVLKLYEPGGEGPMWWDRWPDYARGLPTGGILDRCRASRTCPKIIEHFGAAEIWALKFGPGLVGTDPKTDIPLPGNVRRYYISSTRHGGGDGSFDVAPPAPPTCPSEGYGRGLLPDNPVPHTETRNAIEFHLRNWVMQDIAPPPSRWPRLHGENAYLVAATKDAMGFPTLPGIPDGMPTGLISPVIDYDWGPGFDQNDTSGVPTVIPPSIKQVLPMLVPRVDADGNELGGVPVVLRDAPLGTYLGWNITAEGFHAGKICNYAGGMVPFANTQAERVANGDPRLSLEERYGTHAGYVDAVRAAAANAAEQGFLLPADAEQLIARAEASDVLRP
jgi:hypothetical protein